MKEGRTVYYDGYCRLCSRSVRWIIRNDPRKRFSFVPLQLLPVPPVGNPEGDPDKPRGSGHRSDTLLLIMNGKKYERSGAILRIALYLRFPWPMLGIFFLVPPLIRDAVYRLLARNRKAWFGEEASCYIPRS
ncbi:MAG: DCC1-like thiol-disulfide oxidoreductase family protein [Bacteroidales bacterium]|nr:DCC1-like thiol-disulfide oxidoreductase family protein [Bacteroidales bacterium]